MNYDLLVADIEAKATQTELDPDDLIQLATLWRGVQAERLDLDRQSKKQKAVEDRAQQLLIANMLRNKGLINIPGATVGLSNVSYTPHVMDWEGFYSYIKTSGNFALLERRPSRGLIGEMWDNGETIPGVEKYPVYKLTVSKVKG